MDRVSLLLLALGLSMDAFAVSVTDGLSIRGITAGQGLTVALFFGAAQGIMPLLGYFGGSMFAFCLDSIDHWVALALLCYIGGKMIAGALKGKEEKQTQSNFLYSAVLMQALATSIDAMAAGVGLATLRADIWRASFAIASVTFIICCLGVFIGKRFGDILNQKAEIFGGFILILLGIKIFLEDVFIK